MLHVGQSRIVLRRVQTTRWVVPGTILGCVPNRTRHASWETLKIVLGESREAGRLSWDVRTRHASWEIPMIVLGHPDKTCKLGDSQECPGRVQTSWETPRIVLGRPDKTCKLGDSQDCPGRVRTSWETPRIVLGRPDKTCMMGMKLRIISDSSGHLTRNLYLLEALDLSLTCPTDRRGSLSLLLPCVMGGPVGWGVRVWRGV